MDLISSWAAISFFGSRSFWDRVAFSIVTFLNSDRPNPQVSQASSVSLMSPIYTALVIGLFYGGFRIYRRYQEYWKKNESVWSIFQKKKSTKEKVIEYVLSEFRG
jgi:predicted histidine transporter YuiF (NhaC family)